MTTPRLPRGRLLEARVVDHPRATLAAALDRQFTGYATLQPQESLLLDDATGGVIAFRDGVPTAAFHDGTGASGPAALAALAPPGPVRVELVAVPGALPPRLGPTSDGAIPPGSPAERLAGDPALAASTRRASPPDRVADDGDAPSEHAGAEQGAVEAFLEDEERIAAIQAQAREEAAARAAAWDFPTDGTSRARDHQPQCDPVEYGPGEASTESSVHAVQDRSADVDGPPLERPHDADGR